MSKLITASAKVTLTIEISGLSTWGPECTVSQIRDQAIHSAISIAKRIGGGATGIKVIGEPRVSAIITGEVDG